MHFHVFMDEIKLYYYQIINLPGKEIHTGETGKQVSIVHLSVVAPPRAWGRVRRANPM